VRTRAPALARRLQYGLPLAVAFIVLACFASALGNEFVNWDDQLNLTENPHYRGLSLHHLRWMFSTVHLGHYQPLSWLTLAFDYSLWGMDPTGYHLTNVVLHAGNAVLFYCISLRLLCLALGAAGLPALATTALRVAAAASALFFAIHPLRVESVAWVTERRDVLSGFFYLGTVWAYLHMRAAACGARARLGWFAVSLVCMTLSVLSKAWAMTLPVVLLVLDAYPLRRFASRERPGAILLEKVPYTLPAAATAGLALVAQGEGAEMLSVGQHGLGARVAQAAYGLCFYLGKTLFPVGLSPVYVLDPHLDPTAPMYIGCMLLVLLISGFAIAVWKRWPWLLASWLCYAAIVSPVLGLVQTGPQIVADRYTYLSCLPWALLGAAGMHRISRGREGVVCAVAVVVLIVLGVLTVNQTRRWRDSLTLWDHALRLDPENAVALFSRGAAHESMGDRARAWADYEAAIRLNPNYADAYFGRGNLRRAEGDLRGALADYGMVVQLRPQDPRGYLNRGVTHESMRDLQPALADLTTAIQLDRSCADAFFARGNVKRARADFDGALADYTAFLQLRPEEPKGYLNRGVTYESMGNLESAMINYSMAIRLNPGYAEAYFGRANVRRAQGDLDGALADYSTVIRLQPQDPKAYVNRGVVRQAKGELNGAVNDYNRALTLAAPDWPFRDVLLEYLAAARQQQSGRGAAAARGSDAGE
jgi:tetratricopeptide (TPR) repeat protein